MSREVLHDFWKRWYFPGNATLYLVGDFESGGEGGMDAAEALIRQTFGKIPPGRHLENGVPQEGVKLKQEVGLPCTLPLEFHTWFGTVSVLSAAVLCFLVNSVHGCLLVRSIRYWCSFVCCTAATRVSPLFLHVLWAFLSLSVQI